MRASVNRVALGSAPLALLALLGCGPERRHDSGQPTDLCTELPPLGDAEIFQIAGPRGEGPCTGATGELCLTVSEYALAGTEVMATGDVDGDGYVDAVLLETRETDGCGGREYVRILFGTSDGRLVDGPAVPAPSANRVLTLLALDDLSGDGRDEVVLATVTRVMEETAYQLHLLGLDADRLVEHDTIDLGHNAPATLRTGNFDDRGLRDLYVDFEPSCHGDACGACTPLSASWLEVFDDETRRRVPVMGTASSARSVIAGHPDGVDRIWTQVDPECGGAAFQFSSLRLGDGAIVVEHTIEAMFNLPGMAADVDGDEFSELFLARYPDVSFWSHENEGEHYELRQELPSRSAAGVVRFESVAEDAVFLVLGSSGNANVGTEFRRYHGDERLFSEAELTLPIDVWFGDSFRTRSLAPPRRFILQVWKEHGDSAIWVVSGREKE